MTEFSLMICASRGKTSFVVWQKAHRGAIPQTLASFDTLLAANGFIAQMQQAEIDKAHEKEQDLRDQIANSGDC